MRNGFPVLHAQHCLDEVPTLAAAAPDAIETAVRMTK